MLDHERNGAEHTEMLTAHTNGAAPTNGTAQEFAERPRSDMPKNIKPAASQPSVVPEAFKPSALDHVMGFFVGANFSNHYTRQDVRDIVNIYAPLTWLSAGTAALGISLALEKYAGVPFAVSLFPAAAAYTCLDRSIVRAESIAKADRRYAKLLTFYDEKRENEYISTRIYNAMARKCGHAFPFSFRIGMAVCTSLIAGGVIMERIASNEIATVAKENYAGKNAPLIQLEAQKEKDYDQRIVDVTKHVGDLFKNISEAQPVNVVPVALAPADQTRFDTAKQQITTLQSQIDITQQRLIDDEKRMSAEFDGVPRPGTSGKAGPGPQYKIAQEDAEGDKSRIDQLSANLKAQQATIDQITQQYHDTFAAQQAHAKQINDNAVQARNEDLEKSSAELAGLKINRDKAFAGFVQEMKGNAQYKPLENESGIFADMKNLEDYLQNPKTGVVAQGFMRTLEAFVFLFEMAAVLGAAFREPTASEMIDARKRAGVTGQIERTVMGELAEIIPMRKRLLAMAQSPWDKMHAFYRPDRPSDGLQKTAETEPHM